MCEIGKETTPAPPIALSTVRKVLRLRQQDLARRMHLSSTRISVIENSALQDCHVWTVSDYCKGLGLELELWVRLPDGSRVRLQVDKPS